MANIFVRSTDGLDTDTGESWALAKATLTGAAVIDAAGDTLYLSQAHSESTAAAITLTFAGTPAAPVNILCVDDSAGTPTTLAESAVVATTGASAITVNGSLYAHGITWQCGNAGSSINLGQTGGTTVQTYRKCIFDLKGTNTGVRIIAGGQNASVKIAWRDTSVKFATVGGGIAIGSDFQWSGGDVALGSLSPTSLFWNGSAGRQCNALIEGVDFTNLAATVNFVGASTSAGKIVLRNCKLPASWSGSLILTPPTGLRVEMHNCDSIDTNYRLWVEDYAGSIKSQTLTLTRSGGATDGTVPYSWKMTTSANATASGVALESPEFARWNSVVGSGITVTVDVLHDSVTALTDGDIWLEVQYLGTSGVPLSLFKSDAKADVLATPQSQTASSATWDTTGMTNPNKQKLSVTFTPQEAGYLQAKVVLAKASTTVHADPKLQVA